MNTSHDSDVWEEIFTISTQLEPIAQGDSFDWDDISSKMIGRFEQFEFETEELRIHSEV